MRLFHFLIALLLFAAGARAQTFVNVVGSDEAVAISSYDTVSFFTEKKAVMGSPRFVHLYLGAKWLFSSAENLKAFQASPDQYLPEWGGQCAWCVSENCVSSKKLSGEFAYFDGKLYLFAYGQNTKSGPKDEFLYGRWSKASRIGDGEKFWPGLKAKLEEGAISQPNSTNYRRTRFD
jgi:YHS domain-containing protein